MTNWADLDDFDTRDHSQAKADNRETFPCMKCSGTGTYTFGYINPRSGKCHACNGRGHFLTDPRTRAKAKQSRAKRKSSSISEFIKNNEAVYRHIEKFQATSGFCNSLFNQLHSKGSLSDNQIAAVQKGIDKMSANKVKREESAPVIELTKLHELFGKATESGLKKPALTIDDVRISKAPDTGVNAGSLYVKKQGQYQGKLTAEGKFFAVRSADESIAGLLNDIAADPEGKLKELGRVTGTCCACGRELTDEESIRKGIGPICEQRWF